MNIPVAAYAKKSLDDVLHVCDVFAVTISTFLKQTSITKKEIAKQTGVNISSVFRWQNGSTQPKGAALQRLVALAGGKIRPEDLPPGTVLVVTVAHRPPSRRSEAKRERRA